MSKIHLSNLHDNQKRSFRAPNIKMMLPAIFVISLAVLVVALQYAQAATSP
jgi:hypothetical protein